MFHSTRILLQSSEFFEDYAQAWIPTFVMHRAGTICIFDFFAGTGYDKNGVAGSPIRILKKIKEQIVPIRDNSVEVRLILNELNSSKFALLKQACESFLKKNTDVKQTVQIKYFNEDFEVVFPKLLEEIKKFPSLVFLDQNGIKYLTEEYLAVLESTDQTDFLYFVPSSYILRFGNTPEFKQHLDIDIDEAKKSPYTLIHRSLLKQLRRKLPTATDLKLYPFSLKKGSNIYGIIFGAKLPLAVDKFLSIAWKRNETNGEANFDIYNDDLRIQKSLFGDDQLSKIESFEADVKEKILKKEITNNFELFDYALKKGHVGKHASKVVREMKKSGEVKYEGTSPLVTYDNVYRKKRKLEYTVLSHEKK